MCFSRISITNLNNFIYLPSAFAGSLQSFIVTYKKLIYLVVSQVKKVNKDTIYLPPTFAGPLDYHSGIQKFELPRLFFNVDQFFFDACFLCFYLLSKTGTLLT